MRLKAVDGPLSVHNNNDLLNSPKRINTLQNGNLIISGGYTSNRHHATTLDDGLTGLGEHATDQHTLNNINSTVQDKVQWCSPLHQTRQRELTNNNNTNNHHRVQLLNINNTLAASLRTARHGTASSVCSESSPDDSLLDFEGRFFVSLEFFIQIFFFLF